MSNNPWDSFLEAPYFALVKYGTEVKLGDVPLNAKFVDMNSAERYVVTGINFNGKSCTCECVYDNIPISDMLNDKIVLIDDRDVKRPTTTVTAEGISTGDCECWCLEVSAEQYIAIKGEEDYKLELSCKEDYEKDGLEHPHKETWRLYPDDFIGDKKGKIKLTITVEDLSG